MKSITIGSRVRVKIQDFDRYALGCAESLDGATGTVEREKNDGELLIAFDSPRPTWWTNQSPTVAFWLPPEDLEGAP